MKIYLDDVILIEKITIFVSINDNPKKLKISWNTIDQVIKQKEYKNKTWEKI